MADRHETRRRSSRPWENRSAVFWVKEFAGATATSAAQDAPPSTTATSPAPAATTRQRVIAILRDFVENAFISGVPLAARRNIPLWDRFLWVSVVLVAAGFSLSEIPKTYQRMYLHPSSVQVTDTSAALHSFPFPAISICPKMKIRKREAIEYLKAANRMYTMNESLILPALEMLEGFRMPYWMDGRTYDINPDALQLFSGIDLRDFMTKVFPNCSTVFAGCSWVGKAVDCCKMFSRTISSTGHCFVFNSFTTPERRAQCPLLPVDQRPPTYGTGIWYYHRPEKPECLLARSSGAGQFTAAEIFLKFAEPLDIVSTDGIPTGFELAVQAPNENADMNRGVFVPEATGFMTAVGVTYSETVADPWLTGLPPSQRQCLFEDEVPAVFDNIATEWYTQETCIFACRIAFLAERCRCYPFLLPKQVNQCTLDQYECLIHYSKFLYWVRTPSEEVIGVSPDERNSTLWPDCRMCLPLCALSVYDTAFNSRKTSIIDQVDAAAFIDVFYSDPPRAVRYTEQRVMQLADVMVAYAAAVNLFLGISLMSVVQMVMYFVEVMLQLWTPLCTRLVRERHRWWRPPTPPPTSPRLSTRSTSRHFSHPSSRDEAAVNLPLPFVH